MTTKIRSYIELTPFKDGDKYILVNNKTKKITAYTLQRTENHYIFEPIDTTSNSEYTININTNAFNQYSIYKYILDEKQIITENSSLISIDTYEDIKNHRGINRELANYCDRLSPFLYYYGLEGDFKTYSKINIQNKYFIITEYLYAKMKTYRETLYNLIKDIKSEEDESTFNTDEIFKLYPPGTIKKFLPKNKILITTDLETRYFKMLNNGSTHYARDKYIIKLETHDFFCRLYGYDLKEADQLKNLYKLKIDPGKINDKVDNIIMGDIYNKSILKKANSKYIIFVNSHGTVSREFNEDIPSIHRKTLPSCNSGFNNFTSEQFAETMFEIYRNNLIANTPTPTIFCLFLVINCNAGSIIREIINYFNDIRKKYINRDNNTNKIKFALFNSCYIYAFSYVDRDVLHITMIESSRVIKQVFNDTAVNAPNRNIKQLFGLLREGLNSHHNEYGITEFKGEMLGYYFCYPLCLNSEDPEDKKNTTQEIEDFCKDNLIKTSNEDDVKHTFRDIFGNLEDFNPMKDKDIMKDKKSIEFFNTI